MLITEICQVEPIGSYGKCFERIKMWRKTTKKIEFYSAEKQTLWLKTRNIKYKIYNLCLIIENKRSKFRENIQLLCLFSFVFGFPKFCLILFKCVCVCVYEWLIFFLLVVHETNAIYCLCCIFFHNLTGKFDWFRFHRFFFRSIFKIRIIVCIGQKGAWRKRDKWEKKQTFSGVSVEFTFPVSILKMVEHLQSFYYCGTLSSFFLFCFFKLRCEKCAFSRACKGEQKIERDRQTDRQRKRVRKKKNGGN